MADGPPPPHDGDWTLVDIMAPAQGPRGRPRKYPRLPDRDAEARPAAEAGTDAAARPARRTTCVSV
jgi:hypothetical protein